MIITGLWSVQIIQCTRSYTVAASGKAPRSRFSFRVRACHSFVNLHDGELAFRLEARLSYSPPLLIPGPGRLAFATESIKKKLPLAILKKFEFDL